MPGSRVVLVLLALVVPVAGVLVAFALLPGAAPPDSATNSGDAINQVYWVVLGMAAVVFVLVEATLLTFIFRFRRRRGAAGDVEGPQIHGNTRVEIIWTAIPALLLLGLAIFTFLQIPDVEATPEPGEDVLVVNVTAHQFYWQYEYPNGALSFDTLYLPVDLPVTLVLRSEDVDHSWWVPQLTGKRDAIPGQTNELNFTPNRTGVFEHGVCGEFCGIQHTRMTTRVVVLGTSGFQAFLSQNAPGEGDEGLAELGEQEWTAACAKCHGPQGQGGIGPPIAGNGTLTNPRGLTNLLTNGQDLDANENYMPPVGKGWSDRQIAALIAYIESDPELGGGDDGGG